ncbi:hypothetical protein [Geodermatophilus sp. TF02-6]|uniref:hypothetical protein n=1 Tax=Geodermatophilus sp. TF02-6 TaxID=2250575 RepID=UPI0018F2806C|nr:hypothetical protein [Geodermatophilus sp. TF02-6]
MSRMPNNDRHGVPYDDRPSARGLGYGDLVEEVRVGRSYVVTGGGRGVGRAVVERLLADGGSVVVIELDPAALG